MSDNYGIDDEPSDHDLGNGARQRTPDRTNAGPAALQLPKRRPVFAGYTAVQLVIGAVILIALVWAMWVTRAMTAEKPQRIVKVELSKIVGEYVQAQARSATPPDQVQAQMRSFLASVDAEVQRHGANGEIVMVGEAVLTKGVPDITADVAKAVYATGIKTPVPATPTQMGAMMQGQVPTAPVAAPATAPVVSAQVAPTAPAANPFAGMPVPAAGQDVAAVDPSIAGAAVSTFGGPGVQ